MKKLLRALVLGLALLVLVALVLGAAGWWAWSTLNRPLGSQTADGVLFEVHRGENATSILHRLAREGLLPNVQLARLYLIHVLGDPPLRAGEYRLEPPLSTPEVLAVLISGQVVTYPLTVIEGLTLEETAASIAKAAAIDEAVLLTLLRDPTPILDLDPQAENLEGYLYPDTYHFPKGVSEQEIVSALLTQFRDVLDSRIKPLLSEELHLEPEGRGQSVRELVTLASIVEKEAQLDEERPLIAGVYAHRLRIGMGLYADPTIIYALKQAGVWDGNLRRRDLRLDSPYNTYLYPGLPPSPICSPGKASLMAAAKPAATDFLYFVSRNDGTHVFATSLREHQQNVDRWQRRYWRERWQRERGAASD